MLEQPWREMLYRSDREKSDARGKGANAKKLSVVLDVSRLILIRNHEFKLLILGIKELPISSLSSSMSDRGQAGPFLDETLKRPNQNQNCNS